MRKRQCKRMNYVDDSILHMHKNTKISTINEHHQTQNMVFLSPITFLSATRCKWMRCWILSLRMNFSIYFYSPSYGSLANGRQWLTWLVLTFFSLFFICASFILFGSSHTRRKQINIIWSRHFHWFFPTGIRSPNASGMVCVRGSIMKISTTEVM